MSGANYGPSTHEATIRSPTASYPVQYTTPQANATEHYQPSQTIEFRSYPSHPRASDYPSPAFSPPPISPSSTEEQLVKKKRKRADAHQLKVLNETYARTAFPTTEERLALAHQLDMTARTVQIWCDSFFSHISASLLTKSPGFRTSGKRRSKRISIQLLYLVDHPRQLICMGRRGRLVPNEVPAIHPAHPLITVGFVPRTMDEGPVVSIDQD